MEILLNDSTFTCIPSSHVFVSILRTMLYPSPDAHSGQSQEYLINLFVRIINQFTLMLLFGEQFHLRCLKGPDYTSDLF